MQVQNNMNRNILLITTDQQRYDSLGCNGGNIARTPTIDSLASTGISYTKCFGQNATCTPARSTIITGMHPHTHGAWALGVPLADDTPNVARLLSEHGYNTGLVGKGHFQPTADRNGRFSEGRVAASNPGPLLGFDRAVLCGHGPFGQHYGQWINKNYPEFTGGFVDMVNRQNHPTRAFGGDTFASEVAINPIPRELYHTDWVANSAMDMIAGWPDDQPWFLWLSFPDPHHPWDPPSDERYRVPWKELPLPDFYPGSPAASMKMLESRPPHWLGYWNGTWKTETSRSDWAPHQMTPDQVCEINALVHIKNELIDEACGRVITAINDRNDAGETEVLFTTDHGEFQGEFGLLYKGPFHTSALLHLPMIWRPAPNRAISPAVVSDVVGQIDIAPTICESAGIDVPDWIQGKTLPTTSGTTIDSLALTSYDSPNPGLGMHLRTITTETHICTVYEPSTIGEPTGLERFDNLTWGAMPPSTVSYTGSEGELYNIVDDPTEQINLWSDSGQRKIRDELIGRMRDEAPPKRMPWPLAEAGY